MLPEVMSRLRASEVLFVRPPQVADGAVVSVFRVPPEMAGQRLDVFVCGELHRTSRTRAQAIVRASAYDAGGRKLAPNHRVRPDQHILLWRPPWDEDPTDTALPVLYEDEHLMAIDKPALVPAHPTARYYRNTVIKLLQAARPDCEFLSLGHRLDRETSGVLVVSKSRACDRALKRRLERRDGIEKTYLAITWGVPGGGERPRRLRCEERLELDPDSPLGVKMRTCHPPQGLHAATGIDVRDIRRNARGRTYALVVCDLETGRQHQIRVHLASLGAPVVGDKLYGPDDRAFARAADGELRADDVAALELPRHALHAARLELAHPITGSPLRIEAPLPRDMADFWASLTAPSAPCPDSAVRAPPG
jgi:23S rRNA pseudouridine1911/1915/1917 synthase